eukprot:scaffold95406_cov59-Attheya_sp.AAC.4
MSFSSQKSFLIHGGLFVVCMIWFCGIAVDLLEHSHGNHSSMEMAPLDENGVPKYKGKKRGRKPKKRRRTDPNRPKRQHTAYTYFVQENYPVVKLQHPTATPSKELITMVAQQWSQVSNVERDEWKARAKAQHQHQLPASTLVDDDDDDDDETNTTGVLPDDDPDDDDDDDDDQYEDHLEDQDQDEDGSTTRHTVPGMESSTSKQQGLTTLSTSTSPARRAMKRPKLAPFKKNTIV